MNAKPDSEAKNAVFVIHGIRDKGYWTQKVAAKIKVRAKGKFHSITPSYGYFAIAPFLMPWIRRQKVEWLMDQYVESRAAYPNASFSFVGHSNGTYLLAKALHEYPCCRVKNVVFVGSVVRTDYNWNALIKSARVQKVLNFVATNDLVVSAGAHGLRGLKWFDLGGAGSYGFDVSAETDPERFRNLEYVLGGHSAGLKESQWDEIASFIVAGDFPLVSNQNENVPRNADYDDKPTKWVSKLHYWAPRVSPFVGSLVLVAVAVMLLALIKGLISVTLWWLFLPVLLVLYMLLTRF